jgi:hypothetical protein
MKCPSCEREISVLINTHQFGPICDLCFFHRFPFIIKLQRTYPNGQLYNLTHGYLEETMTLKHFINCGWFIREKRIEGLFEYIKLEYHGKVRCARCLNLDWPDTIVEKCKIFGLCKWRMGKLGDGREISKEKLQNV